MYSENIPIFLSVLQIQPMSVPSLNTVLQKPKIAIDNTENTLLPMRRCRFDTRQCVLANIGLKSKLIQLRFRKNKANVSAFWGVGSGKTPPTRFVPSGNGLFCRLQNECVVCPSVVCGTQHDGAILSAFVSESFAKLISASGNVRDCPCSKLWWLVGGGVGTFVVFFASSSNKRYTS